MQCVLAILSLCLLPPHKIEKPEPVVINGACIYEPIKASRRDTPETLRQVLRENTKHRRICPGK